ncbi:BTAD domain-containing putative transcriptional regulator [Planosporangium sp. 12N6]|uniref:BTAD domain-containing putative transcriptional regulator n=1 Tax=Planosporangium spinosum TaxID=3402278 RepID=UPI003CE6ED7A
MTSDGFGALLRRSRLTAGLTQLELAERSGLTVAAIRDLEQGRSRRPQPRSVGILIDAVGATGPTATQLRAWAAEAAAPAGPPAPGHRAGTLRVFLLGPLIVRRGVVETRLSAKARAVIARLALSANVTVPIGDLTEMLWPADPPKSPVSAVQTHLSRLRAMIGPGHDGVLHRGPAGYRLELADDQLDLAEFRRAVRRARHAARPPEALDLLDSALRMWRGEPLADVPELRGQPLVTELIEERVQAALRYADVAEAAGQSSRVLPMLRTLTAAQPLHEPLHARMVTALTASGLQAEALATFERVRRRLRDELGVDPGAELVEAQRRMLRRRPGTDTPVPVATTRAGTGPQGPAGLPAAPLRFTGRRPELAHLDDLLDAARRAGTGLSIVLSGTAGVGKSALALHWAHRVRHRFPDGQLHADLRGFHPSGTPADPGEVVRAFLSALGEPLDRIPAGTEARVALYRSRTDGRRMLVVLDNARDAEQVRPLLPTGPSCLAVVTSRDPLTGLVAGHGAEPLVLGRPTAAEASELLAARLSNGQAAAFDDIVAGCARLPLALAVIAARAATDRGTPLTALAGRLRRHPLDVLAAGDPQTDVRAALSWSYAILDPPAARLFRLLALIPWGEVSTEAAASLTGAPRAGVGALLSALVRTRLMDEPFPGRYTMHDLLRAYAAELTADQDDPEDRRAARNRLLDHYLHTAQAALTLLAPGCARIVASPPGPGVVTTALADRHDARDWLITERAGLTEATVHSRPLAQAVHRHLPRLSFGVPPPADEIAWWPPH